MDIGTYYYPDQWPRSQWQRDLDNIASHGFKIVHLAEFAWKSLQPTHDRFDFDWLDEVLSLCRQRKLSVILCTPSAVPPTWLTTLHPDIRLCDENGTPVRAGGRRHGSPTSPAFKEATARIVHELAKRYAHLPEVIGWQIDNELSGRFDQNPHAHAAFRQWLKDRYKTIEGLNNAWGTQFWNTYYDNFDQIEFPPSRNPGYGNPHQNLDASRFWSYAYAEFSKLQADILNQYLDKRNENPQLAALPRPFITTNFMPFHQDVNPADFISHLTLTSWDTYPLTGWVENPTDENYRMADPDGMSLAHDFFAAHHGRWALMEVQPGQVNWSGVPVLPYPGAVRLWLWTAIAHGTEFITVYRWRQPLWGIEMFHSGLITTDGVTLSAGGRDFVQTIEETAPLKLPPPPVSPPVDPTRTVGLLVDFEQQWWTTTLPQASRWNQIGFICRWYTALVELGLDVRVILPHQKIPGDLKLLVAPALQMMDDALLAKLTDYAKSGGHLLLTCRTGLMNRHGHLWEGPWAKPILPLIGASIEAYDSLPKKHFGKVRFGKASKDLYDHGDWADLLYPHDATTTLAEYADQFYAGAAAVTQCPQGKGTVTYCGVAAEQPFVSALVKKIATKIGYICLDLPPRVRIAKRGPYTIALNYTDKPVTLDPKALKLPAKSKTVVGSATLPPAGVCVWESPS